MRYRQDHEHICSVTGTCIVPPEQTASFCSCRIQFAAMPIISRRNQQELQKKPDGIGLRVTDETFPNVVLYN